MLRIIDRQSVLLLLKDNFRIANSRGRCCLARPTRVAMCLTNPLVERAAPSTVAWFEKGMRVFLTAIGSVRLIPANGYYLELLEVGGYFPLVLKSADLIHLSFGTDFSASSLRRTPLPPA